ncbi:hypothetical protein [Nocardioides donggukensis]|uniref:N-acetyltransferase domain-containing protein n=1 Tax=Nocardioides donggukensis TaxID=2774019 RepID=A0A927Q166_9ACTN|nr:hypothetical protein [Nocardioides donggukensis]MBD8869174.1 hypothetical protein [Nocardioides donggukensis]
MSRTGEAVEARFRRAEAWDLVALRDLEREAGLAALGHVFDPARHPYPSDEVLARWALVLDEPGVGVEVVDDPGAPGRLLVLVAHDASTVRHLAVAPAVWGRGLARSALARAVASIAAAQPGDPAHLDNPAQSAVASAAASAAASARPREASLWCLVENHRARGLYEHLGWLPGAERREAGWPPYPLEMTYTLPLP